MQFLQILTNPSSKNFVKCITDSFQSLFCSFFYQSTEIIYLWKLGLTKHVNGRLNILEWLIKAREIHLDSLKKLLIYIIDYFSTSALSEIKNENKYKNLTFNNAWENTKESMFIGHINIYVLNACIKWCLKCTKYDFYVDIQYVKYHRQYRYDNKIQMKIFPQCYFFIL